MADSTGFEDLVQGQAPIAPAKAASTGFEDLLQPEKAPEAEPTLMQQLGHGAGLASRAFVEGAAALPNMLMDSAQVIAGYAQHPSMLLHPTQPVTGELQSSKFSRALDEAYPHPQGFVEHAAALPFAIAGGAVTPIPSPTSMVPSNFIGPSSMKAQRMAAVLQRTQDAGFVVPPSTTNPNAVNKTLETIAGKESTQNAARVINQNARNAASAADIGLAPELMTPEAVAEVKEEAGHAFEAARQIPRVITDSGYIDDLAGVLKESHGSNASFPGSANPDVEKIVNTYLQPTFTGDAAVSALKLLRGKATDAFSTGNSELGRAYRGVAQAIEAQLERGASQAGPQYGGLVEALRNARRTYAQASTILDAMDPVGNVSGTKLAAAWRRSEPLSGGTLMAAEHAATFPKANLPANSSNISHLNVYGSIGLASLGEHHFGLPGVAAGLALPMVRGGAKSYLLGPGQAGALPAAVSGSSRTAAIARALAARPGMVAATLPNQNQ